MPHRLRVCLISFARAPEKPACWSSQCAGEAKALFTARPTFTSPDDTIVDAVSDSFWHSSNATVTCLLVTMPLTTPANAAEQRQRPPATPAVANAVIRSSAGGASLLLASLASQRTLTFLLNAALVRRVTPDLLGFARDMELLTATILFNSREMCRLTALRARPGVLFGAATPPAERQQFVNLAWLPVPLGVLLCCAASAAVCGSWYAAAPAAEERRAALLFVLAACVETLAEPFAIMAGSLLLFGVRARTEITAAVVKCVVTFGAVLAWGASPSAWALGALCSSAVILVGYVNAMRTAEAGAARADGADYSFPLRSLLPASVPAAASESADAHGRAGAAAGAGAGAFGSLLRHPIAALSRLLGPANTPLVAVFASQGLLKHALTEGDAFLMLRVASREQRGAYSLVSNYGSLVARVLFSPLEEAARTALAKLSAPAPACVAAPIATATATVSDDGASPASFINGDGASAAAAASVTSGDGASFAASSSARRRRGRGVSAATQHLPPARALAAPATAAAAAPVVSQSAVKSRRRPSRSSSSSSSSSSSGEIVTITQPVVLAAESAVHDATPSPQSLSRSLYFNVLRVVCTIGLLCATLGPPFSRPFVPLLLGRQWGESSGVPSGLAAYAVYLLFLAVNGITEAYVTAAGEHVYLVQYNGVMVASCAASLGAALLFMPRYGLPGLVAANCVGMAVRIVAGVRFIAFPALVGRVDASTQMHPAPAAAPAAAALRRGGDERAVLPLRPGGLTSHPGGLTTRLGGRMRSRSRSDSHGHRRPIHHGEESFAGVPRAAARDHAAGPARAATANTPTTPTLSPPVWAEWRAALPSSPLIACAVTISAASHIIEAGWRTHSPALPFIELIVRLGLAPLLPHRALEVLALVLSIRDGIVLHAGLAGVCTALMLGVMWRYDGPALMRTWRFIRA